MAPKPPLSVHEYMAVVLVDKSCQSGKIVGCDAEPSLVGASISIPKSVMSTGKVIAGDMLKVRLDHDTSINQVFLKRILEHVEVPGALRVARGNNPTADELGKFINDIWISSDNIALLEVVDTMANRDGLCIVSITGNSGNGKTSLMRGFAKASNRAYDRFLVPTFRDPLDLFYHTGAKDGTTYITETPFYKLISEGNAVVLLDEVNRVEPWVMNIILSLTDDDRSVAINTQNGTMICTVGPNVVLAFTKNVGLYTGTYQMDEALDNRANIHMLVELPPKSAEAKLIEDRIPGIKYSVASEIVDLMSQLRLSNVVNVVDLSVRASLNVARAWLHGASLPMAFCAAIGNRIPAGDAAVKSFRSAISGRAVSKDAER